MSIALTTALRICNIQELKPRNAVHITAALLFACLKGAVRMFSRLGLRLEFGLVRDVIVGGHLAFGGFGRLAVTMVNF